MRSKQLKKLQKRGDDDDEDAIAFYHSLVTSKQTRRPKWRFERIDWDEHLQMLRHTRGFQSRYHMTESSFNKLVDILRQDIHINKAQSSRSTSGNKPITAEMVVGAGLRFLGGDYQKTISDVFGISVKSAERIINKFLNAVDSSDKLEIRLPSTESELRECADAWDSVSGAFGIYYGVVGAIDGWLCCIQKPSVQNATDYFSGHYQRFGLNVQAMCDANLHFTYFGVIGPGRTNDSRAFNRCLELRKWLENTPDEYWIVGDNAYTLSNTLLIPFSGASKHRIYNRSYNFYLSQLRIRIEMAFGRLTTKWRIFRRNLDFTLEKNSMICRVAAKLHNYIIDNDSVALQAAESMEEFGVEELPDGPEYNRGYLPTLPSRDREESDRGSNRQHIVSEITSRDLRRPLHNLRRNLELDQESVYEEE